MSATDLWTLNSTSLFLFNEVALQFMLFELIQIFRYFCAISVVAAGKYILFGSTVFNITKWIWAPT